MIRSIYPPGSGQILAAASAALDPDNPSVGHNHVETSISIGAGVGNSFNMSGAAA